MKKLLCLVLSLLMLLSAVPALAEEAEAVPEPAPETETALIAPANEPLAGDRYLEINETNFPDANFREWIRYRLPVSGDGQSGYYLTREQVESTTDIYCSNWKIKNLKGVELFPNLTSLNCWSNKLTALDVSGLPALTYLDCSGNELTALDLSQNPAITVLYCENNYQLSALDISACIGLKELNCHHDHLTILDMSGYSALEVLYCGENQMTALNVSGCTALQNLRCYDNQLSALDLSENPALEALDCDNNLLTVLDISGCSSLETLFCSNNRLTALDLSGCTAIDDLNCINNHLSELELSGCTALEWSELSPQLLPNQIGNAVNGLYSFDLSTVVRLANLGKVMLADPANVIDANGIVTFPEAVGSFVYNYDTGNGLMEVSVPLLFDDDPNLRYLEIDETNFPDANLRAWIIANLPVYVDAASHYYCSREQVESVTDVQCSSQEISSLTGIKLFPNLKTLNCSFNNLSALDVSDCTALESLTCYGNKLTALTVSGCTALRTLDCEENCLTAIDVSNLPVLEQLKCGLNQLAALNVSGCSSLTELFCYDNQLTVLDVSENPILTDLGCGGNQLTTLDISACPSVKSLNCSNNQLSKLNMSGNHALKTLYCENNHLNTLDLSDCTALMWSELSPQALTQKTGKKQNGKYTFDLTPIVGAANLGKVTLADAANTMNAQGVVTFPGPVESFVYRYDTGNGRMSVTVPLTFEEVQPTAPSDVMSTAANFMGKMLVNYYIVMSEEALADKDAYVEIKLNDDVKKVLVRDADTDEKNGVLRHKFEMEVPSKCMRDDIVLKLHAGNGSLLPLTYKQETEVTDGFVYHMVDYLRGRQQNSTSETMRRLAYTAEWYGTACQLYFNHHVNQLTEAEIAAMNEALNDASIMTGLANYAPIEGGTLPNGITKRSNTVVFESDNTLRTYFYTANPGAYTFTMDDNEIHLSEWEAGKYNYDIPNIPGKELAKWHKVTATDGTNTYTYKTSALGYCYGRAANSTNVDMQNLAKTLYLYGKAAMAYFNVPDQPAPADIPADPAAPAEPVIPESLQGRDIQLPIVP